MRDFFQDLRFAVRSLRKTPTFFAFSVLILALGIGANTAIFSLIEAVLLRPLPFPEPERLVAVWEDTAMFGLRYSPVALGNYAQWRARSSTFAEMGALEQATVHLTGGGEPEEVRVSAVTASVFRALGVKPMVGRVFADAEDLPGATRAVLVSYGLWQRRLGARRNLASLSLEIFGQRYGVAGVMPESFHFPDLSTEVWVPMGAIYQAAEYQNRGRHNFLVIGRLEPGTGIAAANSQIAAIAKRMESEYPRTNLNVGAFVAPLRENVIAPFTHLYALLFGAVCLVLSIACANVAGLCLSRASDRRREIAVRTALGAGRARIARFLLVECALLAAAGGALGLALAHGSFRVLAHLLPPGLANGALRLDAATLGFTLALALATSVAFGLAPIRHAMALDLNHALKQGGGSTGDARGTGRLRAVLVVAEVACSTLLLAGSGLMIRSFARLRGVDPGFPTGSLLTARVPPSFMKYKDPARKNALYRDLLAHIRALPGVRSAGFTNGIPVAFKGNYVGLMAEGAPEQSGSDIPTVNYRVVTPGYLETLGVRLRRGRTISESDSAVAPLAAVVNETLARKFWPGSDPIGKRFKQGNWNPAAPWSTVVGVVDDIHQSGPEAAPRPEMYLSYQQQPVLMPGLAIRAGVAPMTLAAGLREAVRSVDPEIPVADIATMDQILDRELFSRRLQSALLAAFSGLALFLSGAGIFALLAYTVSRRSREIALRMALGARPADIVRAVALRGMALSAAGIAAGLAAAAALSRALQAMLFGVAPWDPTTYAAVAILMLALSAAASVAPARRAVSLDPVRVLREE